MSPNKHVPKTYEVVSKNDVTQSDVERFKEGLELSDGLLKPAQLEIIENRRSRVTIYEGKYIIKLKECFMRLKMRYYN